MGRYPSTGTTENGETRQMPAGPPGSSVVQKWWTKVEVEQTGPEEQLTETASEEKEAGRHRKTGHEEVHVASYGRYARYGLIYRSGNM